jgi:DNA (cytosine-5)-methyltransferase 1
MKVLNLYAGIGGNRKLWEDVEVTAVELNKETAAVYQDLFQNDTVIVGDAHQYLLEHFTEFDFIWSSPPCPTHSRINHARTRKPDYPDMKLYAEIIFLNQWFEGKFVVENVIPYYTPLIQGTTIDRHIFWSNFRLGYFEPSQKAEIRMQGNRHPIEYFEKIFGFDLSKYKISDKRQKLRNCVHPETGEYIMNCARNTVVNKRTTQTVLF